MAIGELDRRNRRRVEQCIEIVNHPERYNYKGHTLKLPDLPPTGTLGVDWDYLIACFPNGETDHMLVTPAEGYTYNNQTLMNVLEALQQLPPSLLEEDRKLADKLGIEDTADTSQWLESPLREPQLKGRMPLAFVIASRIRGMEGDNQVITLHTPNDMLFQTPANYIGEIIGRKLEQIAAAN